MSTSRMRADTLSIRGPGHHTLKQTVDTKFLPCCFQTPRIELAKTDPASTTALLCGLETWGYGLEYVYMAAP